MSCYCHVPDLDSQSLLFDGRMRQGEDALLYLACLATRLLRAQSFQHSNSNDVLIGGDIFTSGMVDYKRTPIPSERYSVFDATFTRINYFILFLQTKQLAFGILYNMESMKIAIILLLLCVFIVEIR